MASTTTASLKGDYWFDPLRLDNPTLSSNKYDYLPDDGKRKKAVVQQSFPLRLIHYGGFDKIKAAVPYALI